jgi:hypothetical protein
MFTRPVAGAVLLLEANPDPSLAMFDVMPVDHVGEPCAVVAAGSISDEFNVPAWTSSCSPTASASRDSSPSESNEYFRTLIDALPKHIVQLQCVGNIDGITPAGMRHCLQLQRAVYDAS